MPRRKFVSPRDSFIAYVTTAALNEVHETLAIVKAIVTARTPAAIPDPLRKATRRPRTAPPVNTATPLGAPRKRGRPRLTQPPLPDPDAPLGEEVAS